MSHHDLLRGISNDLRALQGHWAHIIEDGIDMALNLDALAALGARIDTTASSLQATVSGDVNTAVTAALAAAKLQSDAALAAAVAAQEEADQAAVDGVAGDLAAKVTNLETQAGAVNATVPAAG